MVGGGTIFGPRPHRYFLIFLKSRKDCKKKCLSMKAKENEIKIVEDFNFDAPKTKDLAILLKSLELGSTKTLLLLPGRRSSV